MNADEISGKARANFLNGFNCAQSVFCALVEELGEDVCGMNLETAQRLSSSFGGGMGRLREVCGAVSGMFMAAGLVYGYSSSSEPDAKAKHYALIQQLAKKFAGKNSSIVCRELLGLAPKASGLAPDSPVPEARTEQYYQKRPCADLVADAARIFAEYYSENPPATN